MAKDLKAFLERMKEDSAFAEKVKETGDRIKKDEENLGEGEVLVRAAKELGYEFTLGDIDRNIADEQELDDDELASAAGGTAKTGEPGFLDIFLAWWDTTFGNTNWCMEGAYHCAIWDD